jgi:glycosyltransferase involved in cell wall biosynthesis
MRRLGFNAAFYTGSRVGVDVCIEHLVRELARSWELVVYTSEPDSLAGPGIETRTIPGWTRNHRGRFLWVNTQLRGWLERDRVDLVLSPFVESPIVPIPSVAVVHDLTPLVMPGACSSDYTLLFRWSLHRLRRATLLIADSRHTRDDLRRQPGFEARRVEVVPLATDIGGPDMTGPSAVPQVPDGERFLLYVGGFMRHKNLPRLLEACAELKREIPHRLVMVGAQRVRPARALAEDVRRLGLQDRVTVLCDLSTTQLAGLYRRCDLFVYPSRYEGFGLPVLEAMACGAPVLCSRASAIPEVGGAAVRYFAPDSVSELVSGIKHLLSDEGARKRLSVLGRSRAQEFSWGETAERYSALMRDALAGA